METRSTARASCLRVPRRLGQRAIELAVSLKLMDRRLRVKRGQIHLFIPLTRRPSDEELAEIRERLDWWAIQVEDFEVKRRRPRTLIEALEKALPPHLLASLPRSMDIMGRVVVLEVPLELWGHRQVLGTAVMEVNKGVETVLAKAGAVDGEYRVRKYEVIAGKRETETVYREHGCAYHLDPTLVYFSPRLSTERQRVAQQVREGETVVDMFAGVGPFAIQIAKKHPSVRVYAVDVNPHAIHFLRRNIAANRVKGRVIPILGDAREAVEEGNLLGVADRVIMNLPERAVEFVAAACRAIKPGGGTIHFYEFESEPEPLGKAEGRLKWAVSEAGRLVVEVTNPHLVRPTAPHEWQVALDALIR